MSFAHLLVVFDRVDAEADDLGAALRELASRSATAPSSVVQTGVKSLGCENSTAQLSPIHSWKWMVPCVVSAVKSGATSLIRSDIVDLPLGFSSFFKITVIEPSCSQKVRKPTRLARSGWVRVLIEAAYFDSLIRAPAHGYSNSSRAGHSCSASSSSLIFCTAASRAGMEQVAPLRSNRNHSPRSFPVK